MSETAVAYAGRPAGSAKKPKSADLEAAEARWREAWEEVIERLCSLEKDNASLRARINELLTDVAHLKRAGQSSASNRAARGR